MRLTDKAKLDGSPIPPDPRLSGEFRRNVNLFPALAGFLFSPSAALAPTIRLIELHSASWATMKTATPAGAIPARVSERPCNSDDRIQDVLIAPVGAVLVDQKVGLAVDNDLLDAGQLIGFAIVGRG